MTQMEPRTRAYNAGMALAMRDQENKLDSRWFDEDDYDTRQYMVQKTTTEKVDPDSEAGNDIVIEFLQGYYDTFDEEKD